MMPTTYIFIAQLVHIYKIRTCSDATEIWPPVLNGNILSTSKAPWVTSAPHLTPLVLEIAFKRTQTSNAHNWLKSFPDFGKDRKELTQNKGVCNQRKKQEIGKQSQRWSRSIPPPHCDDHNQAAAGVTSDLPQSSWPWSGWPPGTGWPPPWLATSTGWPPATTKVGRLEGTMEYDA